MESITNFVLFYQYYLILKRVVIEIYVIEKAITKTFSPYYHMCLKFCRKMPTIYSIGISQFQFLLLVPVNVVVLFLFVYVAYCFLSPYCIYFHFFQLLNTIKRRCWSAFFLLFYHVSLIRMRPCSLIQNSSSNVTIAPCILQCALRDTFHSYQTQHSHM